jgi:hypothetical protein
MPSVTRKLEVPFKDFFSKYGFNDGDGPEGQIAYDYRQRAIDILNREFKRLKLPYKATDADYGSIHNNCRIEIQTLAGEEVEIYESDPWDFGGEDDDPKTQAIIQALDAAEKAFDASFKKRR